MCARGLYQNPRNVDIKNKPAAQTNNKPELDHNDPAASERVFVLGFGSMFGKTTEGPPPAQHLQAAAAKPDLNSSSSGGRRADDGLLQDRWARFASR